MTMQAIIRISINPIAIGESLWKILKQKVAACRPESQSELIAAIKEVWYREISPELCRKHRPYAFSGERGDAKLRKVDPFQTI